MKSFVFFGDQTVETLDGIRALVKRSRRSPLLHAFLQEATSVTQREVNSLNLSMRSRFYGFQNFVELAERFSKSEQPDDLVATVLITVAQIGELIVRAELDASILGDDAVIIGLCTGALPAAVCAVSKGLGQVLDLGSKVVALSFKLAVESDRRSQQIEAGRGHWGFSVVGMKVADIQTHIDQFCRAQSISSHRRPYPSVIADDWCTISGAPSVLQELFTRSDALKKAPKLRLPFGAAAHAPHLIPLALKALVDASGIPDDAISSDAKLISTGTCRPYQAASIKQLFLAALEDVVQAPLLLSDSLRAVISELSIRTDSTSKSVQMIPVGPNGHISMVQRTLQKAGFAVNLSEELTNAADAGRSSSANNQSDLSQIAIVGMSGRFPGSDNVEAFWQSLLAQEEFHSKVPDSRFDLSMHFDSNGKAKNATSVPYGNFLSAPGLFDNRMFRVSPREALQMDPLQRMALMCTYEALEMAGYSPGRTTASRTSRVGTFFGQAADDYRDTNIQEGVDVYFVPALQRAFVPGRLNHHFGWGGPSYSVDSACASSLSAVTLACSALEAGQCDMAVAGGGSLVSNPAVYAGLSRGSFLSPSGSCRTFQDAADGYCRGEGLGVVVLKRLADAIADRDPILAIVRGTVRNYSAGAISITHPSTTMQQALYREVLGQTGVDAADIGYVEMHGTATQAGDTAEMSSVAAVFGGSRSPGYPLYVGAVKANVGHGEAAAGITSLIKSTMMLQRHLIPGQPVPPSGRLELNRHYPPIHKLGIHVAEKSHVFRAARSGDTRKIMINNFDAAGGNVTLLLEEGSGMQQQDEHTDDSRVHHVLAMSAHTPKSFAMNRQRLLEYLRGNPQASLADVAYTSTARRMHHAYRMAYVSDSVDNLILQLAADDDKNSPPMERSHAGAEKHGSIVFVFTGQGHRCQRMATRLYHTSRRFRRSIDSYHRFCEASGFDSFLELISDEATTNAMPSAMQTQLATIAVELALADLWQSWNVRPSLVIGHSLGEYAALCVAGVLSVNDTLMLVGSRARLLQNATQPGSHAMLAVNLSKADILAVIESTQQQRQLSASAYEIACINGPTATVVSGLVADISDLKTSLKGKSVAATQLDTPYAFHSAQMDPILSKLKACALQATFSKSRVPIASTLKGLIVEAGQAGPFSPDYLVEHTRQPVDFLGALNAAQTWGLELTATTWIECGPHPVCLGLIASSLKSVDNRALLPSLQAGQEDWKVLSTAVSALYKSSDIIDWPQFHHDYEDQLHLVKLPSYAFELKDFWMPFVQHSNSESPMVASSNVDTMAAMKMQGFLTSSLQRIESEAVSDGEVRTVFASSTSEPALAAAIRGHVVDGYEICPTSVFIDMALSAARYLSHRADSTQAVSDLVISHLEMTGPLVHIDDGTQQIVVTTTQSRHDGSTTAITFSSRTGGAQSSLKSHGHCTVRVRAGNAKQLAQDWSKSRALVDLARLSLVASVKERHQGYRLPKPIAYKLFSQLVKYGAPYQTMQEVFVSDDFSQGVAHLSLGHDQQSGSAGNFACNPYWLDALVHLAGFMTNCNPVKPDNIIWLSTSVEDCSLVATLDPLKSYQTFVCCRGNNNDAEAKTILYDAYIFEGGETMIGLVHGIEFHRMERSVFAGLIRMAAPSSTSSAKTVGVSKTADQDQIVRAIPAAFDKAVAGVKDLREASRKDDSQNQFEAILSTVAKQTGVDRSELNDSTRFADLGVDSLMGIAICDVLDKELAMSVPGAFFQNNPTVAHVRKALAMAEAESDEDDSSVSNSDRDSSDSSPDATPLSSRTSVNSASATPTKREGNTIVSEAEIEARVKQSKPITGYQSKAVLVQGRKSSTANPLFLICDGAGSAAAYIHLSSLPRGRPIYALESPFLHDPEAFTFSIEQVSELYLATLRRVKPEGPYLLGGWSAGAVFAYEVSRRLLEMGEEVEGLIMIDMRVPEPLPHLPKPNMALLEASGMTTGINRNSSSGGSSDSGVLMAPMSLRLKQHLLSVCQALVNYNPLPMGPNRLPGKVYMIWAKLGLCEVADSSLQQKLTAKEKTLDVDEVTKRWFFGGGAKNNMEDAESGMMAWFYAKRTTFGSNGWQKLVGQELRTWVVDADHFSMMDMPRAAETGQHIKEAVEECSRSG